MRIQLAAMMLAALATMAAAAPCTELAKIWAQDDAAKQAAEARYQKVLADRKLKPLALPQVRLYAHDIDGTVRGDFKVDRVETADQNGAKVAVVTAMSGSCGGTPGEFVQQGSKIFRVERRPKPGKTTTIESCQCVYSRGGCGGARVVSWAIGYVLPAGTTFAGVMPIEYVADAVQAVHAAACPPEQPRP